ncbi:hypothetical protein [Variovorax ureilyticus]|uniref:hypothetical protein n=1 Tax=Variovorax ureilyticus TaxID=1836198 RepID=UPI003BF59FEC
MTIRSRTNGTVFSTVGEAVENVPCGLQQGAEALRRQQFACFALSDEGGDAFVQGIECVARKNSGNGFAGRDRVFDQLDGAWILCEIP